MQSKDNEDFENNEEDSPSLTSLASKHLFNAEFVKILKIVIQDVGASSEKDHATLLDTLNFSFCHILRLASSITGSKGPASDFLVKYTSLITQKIELIAEALAQERNPEANPAELAEKGLVIQKQIFQEVKAALAANLQSNSKLGLTYHAAHLIINFTTRLMQSSKPKLESHPGLNLELCLVADSLYNFNKSKHFAQDCQKLFSFFISEEAFNVSDLASTLQNCDSEKSKYYILGCCYAHDRTLTAAFKFLNEHSEKLVFNDKNKDAMNAANYFKSFYQVLDEKLYLSEVHSQVQFAMNRNHLLLANVTELASCLKSFSPALAAALTVDLLASDYLIQEKVTQLVKIVCERVTDAAEFSKTIVSYLMAQYEKLQQNPNSLITDQLKVLKLASICVNLLQSDANEVATVCSKLIIDCSEEVDFEDADIKAMLKRSSDNTKMSLERGIKHWTASQVTLLKSLNLLNSKDKVLTKLLSQKFDSVINSSQLLAYMAYLNSCGMTSKMLENESISKYLLNGQSLLNTPAYFKKPLSELDVVNHVHLIQRCLLSDLRSPLANLTLEATMIEYILNKDFKFRSAAIFECLRAVSRTWNLEYVEKFMKQIFQRVQQLYTSTEQSEVKQCFETSSKVCTVLTIILPADMDQSSFTTMLQLIAHPLVSPTVQKLQEVQNHIKRKVKWEEMFKHYQPFLIQKFLKDRTGIMSPNATVKQVAVNVLIMLGWSGLLEQMLVEMGPIFNYKPIEMLEKVENLFTFEFERISHYDLMFYSEMTQNMLAHFKQKDEALKKEALNETIVSLEVKPEEETKQEIKADLDFDDDMLTSLLAKKSKKAKKTTKEAPKKAAVAAPKTATKAAAKPEPVEMDKAERNKQDRAQILKFISTLTATKVAHIKACFDIIRFTNRSAISEHLSYQDLTFQHLTRPLLKLLYLPATRFDSFFFVQNILTENQTSPFFKIKASLLSGLLAIAETKLTHKSISEIQTCLMILDENADFTQMGPGNLQVCLTVSNYVLKDAAVNLSVKETGLRVASSILENNTEVQMIDLVRLTVNMLKTNYISPSLGVFLKKLIRRTSKIEIALLLQPLFEYQPVPRKVLMNELFSYDEPLFCPVWFSTQIWMLLFDEDLALLARKINNKFGITLRSEVFELKLEKESKNLFHYMRDSNHSIFQTAVKASSAAIQMLGVKKISPAIEDLIAFYNSEWDIIKLMSIEQTEDDFRKDKKLQLSLIADQRLNRIAVPQILKVIAGLLQSNHLQTVLSFLVTQACLDQNAEVALAASDAISSVIKNQGFDNANNILQILESLIDSKENGAKVQAVMSIGMLAHFLNDTAQKKLVGTFERLLELLSKGASESVSKAVCKCIPHLAKFFPDKAKNLVKDHLTKVLTSKEEKVVKASTYCLVGLLKALGMSTIAELDILTQVKNECFESKKIDPIRKQAGLFFYDTLSFSMGKSFEVYLTQIFPHILGCISDTKEPVRQAALSALKTIMATFSNFAIKQALPQFIKELQNDNWRSKFSTVEALGNMAYCAPKQISNFLPQIVKSLREILNDTHEKVHEAAIEAIKKIGSVIKCPEIGDMLEAIVNALANTNTHLNYALKLLLETSFVHAIDAPSLSLLVPLLDAGLTMHDNQSKQMAAQLMGNICSLTQDPKDLLPYMPILVPAIKTSLFDAIPEIRASSAKALGRLSKGLGIDHSLEMLSWLREHLDKPSTQSSEKSGAAQGFAEMISSHGIPYFEEHIQFVIKNCSNPASFMREAYRGVLVFLPGCYDRYVEYLPMLVPIMIAGLADEVDEVRKISMRNVKICIKQFAKHSPNQLVIPVMRMMFDKDFRVRESSSILMFQLVKELENDVIKATPKYVDQETKHRILASMFILKYDPIEKVYTQAGQIWKSIVDNQLLVLRQIIDTLIRAIFQIIQSDSYELQEMGLSCIRGIVEKMGEKLVINSIEIFEELLNQSSQEASKLVGICRVMFNMAQAASFRLLQTISPRIVAIIDPYMSHESNEIRDYSSKVFTLLFQRQPDKAFIDPILDRSVLYKLKELLINNNEVEAERLIKTIKSILEQAPELKIEDRMLVRCDINEKKGNFTIAQARVIKALAPVIAPKVYKKRFYFQVLAHLQEELKAPEIDDTVRIQNVLMAYAELISNLKIEDGIPAQEEISSFFVSCQELARPGFWLDFLAHYCNNSKLDIEKNAAEYLECTFKYMNYPDEALVTKVITAFEAIMERLPKETQMMHIPLIRRQIELNGVQEVSTMHSYAKLEGSDLEHLYKKKVPILNIFKQLKGVQAFVNYTQAAIMHGSVNVRIDAAFTFKYMLDFAPADVIKKEIIKICGALIRVVNDKFPQELKMQILLALKLIQKKNADSAKAMQAQLQTTFLKALGDSQSTIPLQRVVIENTILLVKGLLRVDPIVKELCSLIESSKIEGKQKEQVSECLALIIRAKGKSIQPAMAETVASTLTNILQSSGDVNEIVLVNCAVALAYLSAHASDPKQMSTLFDAFQSNLLVDAACKFGVLTNDSPVDKSKMATHFEKLLTEWLRNCSGFVEINASARHVENDENFKFRGAIEVISHLMNAFGRREWCQAASSPQLAAVFRSITQSQIFKQLAKKTSVSEESFNLLVSVLAKIPVKTTQGAFSSELAEVIKDGFNCIQPFYLEFSSQNQGCTDALLNLLQLNFDQFLEIGNDDSKVRALNSQYIKEASLSEAYKGLISDDMRLYAADIILKKK